MIRMSISLMAGIALSAAMVAGPVRAGGGPTPEDCLDDKAHPAGGPPGLRRQLEDGRGVFRERNNQPGGDPLFETVLSDAGLGNLGEQCNDPGNSDHPNESDGPPGQQ